MEFIRTKLSALRPVRLVLAVCVCALLVFSYVVPAYSATSSPTKGEDNLLGIEKESQKEALNSPKSLKETTEKASRGGVNAVQGTADANKMYAPEDTNTPSVEEKIGNALENFKGKVTGE